MQIILEGEEVENYYYLKTVSRRIDELAQVTASLTESIMTLKDDILAQLAELNAKVDEVRQAEVNEDVVQEEDRAALRQRVADLEAQVAAGIAPEDAAVIQQQLTELRDKINDTPVPPPPPSA